MVDKQAQLDQIKAEILAKNVCPNLAENATQLVFGDGNPNAEIVFIGEAPGKNEDLQGIPFVGAAGKFLNEMLGHINLKREDIYITNIVKYRPPNNRDPEPDEKAAFLPYLEAQLEVIQPLLIVTLGRHSMNCFLPGLSIGNIHGHPKRIKMRFGGLNSETTTFVTGNDSKLPRTQMATDLDAGRESGEERSKTYDKVRRASTGAADKALRQEAFEPGKLGLTGPKAVPLVILPLFHPAAALYNGGMRQTLIDDFMSIPAIIELLKNSK